MRQAATEAARRKYASAESSYRDAAERLPSLAAPCWHLGFLYLDWGRIDEARQMYRRALELDPSYRTAYNSTALWEYWGKRWSRAGSEYRRTLALDPSDAYACLGLGWLAMEEANWGEAESELKGALAADPNLLDAHRALGKVYRKLGRWQEAAACYEISLRLALSGREPLRESPVVSAERPAVNDGNHFVIFRRLGQMYNRAGVYARATQCLRMAAAGGENSPALHLRLAAMAFRLRQWSSAAAELARACRESARWMGRMLRWLSGRISQPLVQAYELWRVR
jgi:tetratricopeptide (TPR) repeat protein